MKILDLSYYKFKCLKCGDCCYRVVIPYQFEESIYSYNFRGKFVLNPSTSVSIHFLEKPPLERKIKDDFRLTPRFYPQIVFFLKDFHVGFIHSYQIGVKKKKLCMFYDRDNRQCRIYSIRPAVCRYYPLHPSLEDPNVPRMKLLCKALWEELNQHYKEINIEDFSGEAPENLIEASFPKRYSGETGSCNSNQSLLPDLTQ